MSRCAVNIDIINILSLQTCILKSGCHHQFSSESFRMRCCNMESVGTHALAHHFCIDFSSAGLGVLQFLKNQATSTFTHDETVTACAERAGSMLRIIIQSRQCVHGIEATHTAFTQCSLCSTSENNVSLAQTDQVERICQCMRRGCTCRCRGIVGSIETILDGNLTCSYICNHFRDEERVEFRAILFVFSVVRNLLLECFNTTDTNSEDDTDAGFVCCIQVDAAIVHCLFGSYHCILSITIHLARFFAVNIIINIQSLHFAAEVCFELRCVKMSNRCGAANSGNKVVPCFFRSITNGSDCSHACYYNSF